MHLLSSWSLDLKSSQATGALTFFPLKGHSSNFTQNYQLSVTGTTIQPVKTAREYLLKLWGLWRQLSLLDLGDYKQQIKQKAYIMNWGCII